MRELSGAGEAKNDVGGLRKLSEANVERNVGNIERRTIMNEKIIVSQDGTVFNGKNIIKICYKNYRDSLFKVYIQDISEEYTEIYCGYKIECQSYLNRLSIMLNGPDSVVRLGDLFED